MTLPRRRGQIWTGSEEGTAVYLEKTDTLHLLNPSALAIWELCDGSTSPEEMAEAISELTGIAPEEAIRTVEETLDVLRDRDLIAG